MLSQIIQTHLAHSVNQVFESLQADQRQGIIIPLEQPANLEHGDYSTNIAMQLAKSLRMAPLAIAGLIAARLEQQGNMDGLLRKVEVVAPGFINLFMDWQEWAGRSFALPPGSGDKIVIEHTSVNPNKSMHLGHLRNSCIGDVLVRMLRKTGHTVEVHNYIDDLGNQLADTVVGLLHVPFEGEYVRFGDYCWDLYAKVNKEYTQHPEMTHKRTEILHGLEEGQGNMAWLGNLVAERIVREHIEEMRNFGIEYDLLVWESSIVKEGFWAAASTLLEQTAVYVRESEGKLAGCWVLKQAVTDSSGTADSEEHLQDKVLVRSNGILTYTAKDIAYHLWKFGLLDRDFSYTPFTGEVWTTGLTGKKLPYGKADRVINVIDYRQEYPQQMVKQALQALGFQAQAARLHHVSYGVVSLSPASAAELGINTGDDRHSYAMSGRQGIGIKVTDLALLMEKTIEEARPDKKGLSSRIIAIAAIRYYLLRYNLGTEIVFDFRQATEISGNTGVYLLYSYARAHSVLNKGQDLGITVSRPVEFPQDLEKSEAALLRHLSAWPDTLYNAGKELAPSLICTYAHGLATLFNNFYAVCPILKGEEVLMRFRLWITSAFVDTFSDVLQVLGLPAPGRM
ncbi:arginine--tRNA ligase [Paenibacillus albidus]|uniref:arginine--tRNA ligase n=1 Tax=Paenibacillus albidus TaxID=2041023 RepID=UPI001BEB6F5F|nr:arginine--tRNA ligase [Paenibacillus albidus]MBT2290603.1 arginine--tRNA ligase [Paenibacillus albidus]